jgi:thiol-disulfide isomerase/thioredoxin
MIFSLFNRMPTMHRFSVLIGAWLLLLPALLSAQKGYNIRVKLDNYAAKEVVLGFHYGEKQYVKDTAEVDAEGFFTFKADTLFPPGVYLLVLKPDNNFIQVMLPADDQDLTLTTDAKDAIGKIKIKGSTENEVFYDYMKYLASVRPESDTLKAQFTRLTKTKPEERPKSFAKDSVALLDRINDIDKKVKKYQADMVAKHPDFVGSKVVKASMDPELPTFSGNDTEQQRQRYYWYRAHYFDNIDIGDPVLLRSPVLHQKMDYYVTKLLPQHPDSINLGLDQLFAKMKPNSENQRYYIIHFLNHYAKIQLVGFDACYVHIGKKYYCNGVATWAKKDDVEKICDNVARLEPILIGKIAPNITVKDKDNKPVALYDVDADYTVLFFWAPDCGHCKKAAPFLVEFAKNFKSRGVKVFNVCTAVNDKAQDECWKGIEEKGFSDEFFINTYDPYVQSRYKKLYDVQTTPQIFILDRKHEILMKRITGEQLGSVMESVMKIQEEKKKQGK